MNVIQLQEVDLNLLVVLDTLLEERSVTRAAERLHLTPSAVSHALKRLRELFDDELLIRDGRRMRPTVRAEDLAESLPRLLAQVSRTIQTPDAFDPTVSTRTFRLSAPDFIAPLLPTLLRLVHADGPGIGVEIEPYTRSALHKLADGNYDGVVARAGASTPDLRAEPLGSWPWAVFARADHPAFDDWSPAAWSTHPHMQVRTAMNTGAGTGPTNQRAEELGIRREVRAVVPHFSMAAPLLAETDLLLTVPTIAMGGAVEAYELDFREPPFERVAAAFAQKA